MDRRFARPHTGALNVRALFGDEDNVPMRAPIREHTEIAPSAMDPSVRPGAPRFAPPGSQGHPAAAASPAPGRPREQSAPRGRRRPAPRPRPNYSGFDAADSGHGETRPAAAQSPQSRYTAPPGSGGGAPQAPVQSGRTHVPPRPRPHQVQDPAASGANLPRPRTRERGEAQSQGHQPHQQPQMGRGYDEAAATAAASPYGTSPPVQAWASPQAASVVRLVLVGRDGREGEAFPLPPAGIEIGRSGGIAFPSDPFVSPQHAKIMPIEGGAYIADLSSRNGVYLRVSESTPVYPGDHFLLGNQLLRLDRLETPWQEEPLDEHDVRGFGSPVKPPWAVLVRVCVGEIEDDRYHLRGTEMTIGREQGEIVFPSDGFLSRAHARVRMDVQGNTMTVMLEDLGSANGTYLRLRGAANVGYGAMFRIGDQIFRVRHD